MKNMKKINWININNPPKRNSHKTWYLCTADERTFYTTMYYYVVGKGFIASGDWQVDERVKFYIPVNNLIPRKS